MSKPETIISRYKGCLLGGAVGDALGYPVEFISENSIVHYYGKKGISTLEEAGDPAVVSDDTQMTLFAAEGIMMGDMPTAYFEWLGTQGNNSKMDKDHPKTRLFSEPRLHALRAPGNTCISALINSGGSVERPINNSKGCGTVMRAAPYGLAFDGRSADSFAKVYDLALKDAAFTHGHPMAWISSIALAEMVHEIIWRRPDGNYRLEDVVLYPQSMMYDSEIAKKPECRGFEDTMRLAVKLALDKSISDIDGIHKLGEGWIAEEALYIAVFCAVRYQDDFASAIRAAVNHKGDSDSTGAVCGNLLGAWLGEQAVRDAFDLSHLEMADLIDKYAEMLYNYSKSEE